MSDLIHAVDDPQELGVAVARLRECALQRRLTPAEVVEILERWGAGLRGGSLDAVPGVAFLRLWLRRGTLEPILTRELGPDALHGEWRRDGTARLRAFPVGVVGHWPAGNIEIQPLLSMTCSLLGGNACLVRVPAGLVEATRSILEKLLEADPDGSLSGRIFMAAFDHERMDLHRAMAESVDGAMIWGGAEAVSAIRALPFPPWARLAVFGPRLSVAAMDADIWTDERERRTWCQRMARDVWQFDQEACSSPQTLFLERRAGYDPGDFVRALKEAFAEENRLHPRREMHPALASAICLKRATWILEDEGRQATFPARPDWTILLGASADIPAPLQGRTLYALEVENLLQPIEKFDGMVQTLGLAVKDPAKEDALALAAGHHGVDRVVKLGRMHVFGSPWDGTDLVRPMVRIVRHVPSISRS